MTRDELLRELLGRGLSPYAVYIDGVRDDGWPADCCYLLEKPAGFEVGYQERNEFSPFGTYADEAEACAVVFDRIAASRHWPGQPSADEPIGWTAAMRESAVVIAERRLQPAWDELADLPGEERRLLIQPPLALDAVPGRPDLLRPARATTGSDLWHTLVDDVSVAARINPDGDLELRVPDGGVNAVTVDDLVRRGALRQVHLVEDEGQG